MPKSRRYSRDKSLMLFRTQKWYMGEYSEATEQRINAASARRLKEIIPALPADLRTLTTIDLNDANCARFERHVATGLLEITLRAGDSPSGYFDLNVRYEQATLLSRGNGISVLLSRTKEEIAVGAEQQCLPRIARRAIKSGDTIRAQVLYHEVDIVADGLFEHRMLLWPYGEILIRFTGLSLTRMPVASRDAP